ncbi:MAG: GNAT family N-acetyltransferase [Defluviitaleaceae bacterium]|nr:GNAT family N-acetyltransferase [Defluviitaleaceae bacterium]
MQVTNRQILYNLLYEDGMEFAVCMPDSGAIAIQYHSKPLWMYAKDNLEESKLQDFFNNCISKFKDKNKQISGIVAPFKMSKFFEEIYGKKYPVIDRWELAAFFLPKPTGYVPQGQLALFDFDDVTMVSEWIIDFYREALKTAFNKNEGVKTAIALIGGKKLFGLKVNDLGIVAMGMINPLSYGMSRLNLIYTSPIYRGRGFGKDITAILAGKLQAEGSLPVLYARVKNTAAMSLYQSLGFIEAGRLIELRF